MKVKNVRTKNKKSASIEHPDLSHFVVHGVNNVLLVMLELEVIENSHTLVVYRHSRCLKKKRGISSVAIQEKDAKNEK
jgi:hypothetical protein